MSDLLEDPIVPKLETALPREYYVSQAIFDQEIEKVLHRQWLVVGHVGSIREPESYFVKQVGPESLIIARDKSGTVRAYFNVCRHRGSRMLDDGASGCAQGIVCPYHKWTYDMNGQLRRVPGTKDGQDFAFGDWPLHEAMCEVLHGFIFVWLDKEPGPTLREAFAHVDHHLILQAEPEKLKLAHRETYILQSNWKAMMENDMECYHCGHGGHPSLAISCEFSSFFSEPPKDPTAPRQHFPLRDGMKTFSMDGKRVSRRNLGNAQDGYSAGFLTIPMFSGPVLFVDHAVSLELTPLTVDTSLFTAEWYVHEDAVEGVDYDVDKLIGVFHVTNQEDKVFGERNYRGMTSSRFVPGPLHPRREDGVIAAYSIYRQMMAAD